MNVPASSGTVNDFVVLPQLLAHTAKDIEVAVTFTSKVGNVTSPESTLSIKLKNGQISSPGDHAEWAPNKRYVYTIKFVGDQIILDPRVVVYDTDVNVTLPDLSY